MLPLLGRGGLIAPQCGADYGRLVPKQFVTGRVLLQ